MKDRIDSIDIFHDCIASTLDSLNCETPQKEIIHLKFAVDSARRGLELLKKSLDDLEKSTLLRWKAGS